MSEYTGLAKYTPIYYTYSYSLPYHIFSQLSTLHPTYHKNTGLTIWWWGDHFLMKSPMSCETCIKQICMLFTCQSIFISLIFRPRLQEDGGEHPPLLHTSYLTQQFCLTRESVQVKERTLCIRIRCL